MCLKYLKYALVEAEDFEIKRSRKAIEHGRYPIFSGNIVNVFYWNVRKINIGEKK
jgi:hypothetical protein